MDNCQERENTLHSSTGSWSHKTRSLKLFLPNFEIMAQEKAEWGTLFRYVEHFCQSINL